MPAPTPVPTQQWTKELVSQRLQGLQDDLLKEPAFAPSAGLWAYREAAAVLSSFDPDNLKPVGEPEGDRARLLSLLLLNDCTPVGDAQQAPGHWALSEQPRRASLKRLVDRGALKDALQANPQQSNDSLRRIIAAYTEGVPRPLDTLSLAELIDTLQVIGWLEGYLPGLPSRNEVQRRIDRENLLQPLRDLVGDHFRGRTRELEVLREYVGALPISPRSDAQKKPPLLIYGPGGMGKSTLLAQFVLEHAERKPGQQIPFTYLDFDRPSLPAEQPLRLLQEAVRQLGIQYPEGHALCERLGAALQESLKPPTGSGPPPGKGRFLEEFQKLLRALGVFDQPLLFVLDTFEEVQYRSQDFVAELWSFLNELQDMVPHLRTVLAGRAPVKDFPTQQLELTSFDTEVACGLLEHLGVTGDLARRVVDQVGGVPLTLKLAAEVIKREGASQEGLRDFGLLFARIGETQLQAQLYRRILSHIHDEEVRALAHPGLVLRRLDAELILHVLAKPCGLNVRTLKDAEALLRELAREVSLVAPADAGSLRHRLDVRRVMLDLLRRDKPEQVDQIHRAAVAYYREERRTNDPLCRAEEIYHRLSQGQRSATIEKRWLPGVEDHLRSAVEELPPQGRAYLASKLKIHLDDADWERAELADWERQAQRRAHDLLQLNKPQEALAVVRGRAERMPASPLYLLEALALERLVEWDRARQTLETGIVSATQAGDRHARLDLLTALARVCHRVGDFARALEALARAVELAADVGDPLRQLALLLETVQVCRAAPEPAHSQAGRHEEDLLALFRATPVRTLARQPALLRCLAAHLAERAPDVVAQAIRLVGFGTLSSLARRVLSRALATWDEVVSAGQGQPSGVLVKRAGLAAPAGRDPDQVWFTWGRRSPQAQLDAVVRDLLGRSSLPPAVVQRFADCLRAQQEPDLWGPAHAALLEAYPNRNALTRLLRETLDESLDEIAPGRDLRDVVSELIRWAQAQGRLEELIQKARSQNPASRKLAVIAETVSRSPDALWSTSQGEGHLPGALVTQAQQILCARLGLPALAQAVSRALGRGLTQVTPGGSLEEIVSDVLRSADAMARVPELIHAAWSEYPEDEALANFAQLIGLRRPLPPVSCQELIALRFMDPSEELIALRFMDPEAWQARRAALAGVVCCVEGVAPEGNCAGAVLLGRDLILAPAWVVGTHAATQGPPLLRVLFRGGERAGGEVRALAEDWLVDRDEEQGYVLLRLATGPDAGAGQLPGGLVPPEGREVDRGEVVAVVAFPPGGSLSITLTTVTGTDPGQGRMAYRGALSGGGCFTAAWELAGLPLQSPSGEQGEAILFSAVVRRLRARRLWATP
jgi:cellulose synthase operon protein C